MSPLTKNTERKHQDANLLAIPVKSGVHIYENGLVCTNANGLAIPATDAAGNTYHGVARKEANNTNGSDSSITVTLWIGRQEYVTATGADQTWVGKKALIVDDNTIALTSTNSIEMGTIVAYINSTTVTVLRRV